MAAFLRCLFDRPKWVTIDPDPEGSGIYIQICAHCEAERGSRRHP